MLEAQRDEPSGGCLGDTGMSRLIPATRAVMAVAMRKKPKTVGGGEAERGSFHKRAGLVSQGLEATREFQNRPKPNQMSAVVTKFFWILGSYFDSEEGCLTFQGSAPVLPVTSTQGHNKKGKSRRSIPSVNSKTMSVHRVGAA